jgi:hypothetical protein
MNKKDGTLTNLENAIEAGYTPIYVSFTYLYFTTDSMIVNQKNSEKKGIDSQPIYGRIQL